MSAQMKARTRRAFAGAAGQCESAARSTDSGKRGTVADSAVRRWAWRFEAEDGSTAVIPHLTSAVRWSLQRQSVSDPTPPGASLPVRESCSNRSRLIPERSRSSKTAWRGIAHCFRSMTGPKRRRLGGFPAGHRTGQEDGYDLAGAGTATGTLAAG